MTSFHTDIASFEPPKLAMAQEWLMHSGLDLVVRHVQGKIAKELTEAANMMLGSADKPRMEAATQDQIKRARKLENFLEVLNELQGEKQFSTVKITIENK
jgi:hypothetical protein